MLRWVRRVFGFRAPVVLAAPVASAVSVVTEVTVQPETTGAIAVTLSDDPVVLGEALQARLLVSLEAFTAESAHEDAKRLAEALSRSPTETIRQVPNAAQRALALCQRDEPDLRELIALCGEDPALAQSVLRAASAAFYGGTPCNSLADAAIRIGTGGVRSAIVSVAVSGLLCRPGSAFGSWADAVWSHMTRTAPLAQRLAPAFAADRDEAFTVGLLHDIGKLVVFDAASQLRGELRRDLSVPPAVLADLLRAVHEPLGGLAVLRWGLGSVAARAVATHHRRPSPDRRDPLSEVAFLAERIDLAGLRGTPLDLSVVWDDGALTGAAARVQSLLAKAA